MRFFCTYKTNFCEQEYMKEKKEASIGVRLTRLQSEYIDKIVSEKGLKNRSEALQYLINKAITLG